MMKNKSIILLSGGLDSFVSLAVAKDEYNVQMALTFDYGQRAKEREISASSEIARFYGIENKVINLPFLAEITQTSLVNQQESLPELQTSELDNVDKTEDSAKRVWVPNRNGLFINVAASFADSFGFTHIIFGANSEEAATFPDNSAEFVEKINESLELSTLVQPKVYAPLVNYNKKEIVKLGLEHNIPFNLVRSCYMGHEKQCGECESCLRLKRALSEVADKEIIEKVFGE